MDTFERFAVEHPRARRAVIAGMILALAAYVGWRSLQDAAAVPLAAAATTSGIAVALLAARVDRRIYRASPARAIRWSRRASFVAVVVASGAVPVLAPSASSGLEVALCSFLLGFLAVAAFAYPLPAERRGG